MSLSVDFILFLPLLKVLVCCTAWNNTEINQTPLTNTFRVTFLSLNGLVCCTAGITREDYTPLAKTLLFVFLFPKPCSLCRRLTREENDTGRLYTPLSRTLLFVVLFQKPCLLCRKINTKRMLNCFIVDILLHRSSVSVFLSLYVFFLVSSCFFVSFYPFPFLCSCSCSRSFFLLLFSLPSLFIFFHFFLFLIIFFAVLKASFVLPLESHGQKIKFTNRRLSLRCLPLSKAFFLLPRISHTETRSILLT